MKRFFPHLFFAVIFAMLFAGNADAQTCLVVSPSGSGSHTGADWNNALTGLPSTLVRGTVYYLADGNYGQYHFSSASGTGWVEVRKAQSYDNCTSTGWNTSTMGSSQAIFTRSNSATALSITIDQVIINGNGQPSVSASMPGGAGCGGGPSDATNVAAGPVTPSDCGIRAISQCTSTSNNSCDAIINMSGSADNVKLLYMEWFGNGNPNSEQYPVRMQVANDNSATRLIEHVYQHSFGANIIYTFGHRQVDHSYFWGNQILPSTGNHGQYSYDGYLSPIVGLTEFNNVYRDIQGTAVWGIEDGPQVASDIYLYNNFIISTSPRESWMTLGINNGTLSCLNGSTCSNVYYVNNTHVNTWGARIVPSYQDSGTTTSNFNIQNNLWYNMINSGGPITKPNGTESNNSFLNSGTGICFSGSSDVCTQTSANPFTNSANFDYTLASDAADWNNRMTLGSPYNMDAAGDAFTSDRGAYQFGTTTTQVNPPTGLTAVVN
jgi:hypothetical protein